MRKIAVWVLLLLILLHSCRKEDTMLPELEWITPNGSLQLSVIDTVDVHVKLLDNEGLNRCRIQLLDENMIPAIPAQEQQLSGTEDEVRMEYVVGDIRLPSGLYYLMAEVRDESGNTNRGYRSVQLTEFPKLLKGFFTAHYPQANTLNVYRVDSTAAPVLWKTENSDFGDMAVSAWWQQVYVCGDVYGKLNAFSIDGSSQEWSKSPTVSTSSFWSDLYVKDRLLYTGWNGPEQFRSFDNAGTQQATYPMLNLHRGVVMCRTAGYIYTVQKEISTGQSWMVVYAGSGGTVAQCPLNMEVQQLLPRNEDEVYVIGNAAGQGQLKIYERISNGTWTPVALSNGSVNCAEQISSNTLLLGHSDGNVYRFEYNPLGVQLHLPGVSAQQIRYDVISNSIYVASGTSVLNYNGSSLIQSWNYAAPVLDLELWYNR
jgi:hypothetical protein